MLNEWTGHGKYPKGRGPKKVTLSNPFTNLHGTTVKQKISKYEFVASDIK